MANARQPNRGSEWRKWDLHMHSPFSFLNNQFGNVNIDRFVEKIRESGVVAVGLTNYFRFDDSELTEIIGKLAKKEIVVFPNIEFRTHPKNKENEAMHVHLLFSNTVSTQNITNFLGRLKTLDGNYCRDLKTVDINDTPGVAIDTLKRALNSDEDIKYLRDYMIAACPRGQGNFRPLGGKNGRGKATARVIDEFSDILFGNAEDTEFFLDEDRHEKAKAKPVFLCSDAHKIDDIGTKFSWVKSDVNFEGLKQTLYEPEKRVLIRERNPSESKTKRLTIKHATYKTPSGKEKIVYFNRDLNSIIGKRGSGKSTLLKNLAQKINSEEFSRRDERPPYKLDNFEVVWEDDQKNGGTEDSPKSIFYIPQGYLGALTYDDGAHVSERDDFLTQLLKKNERFANAIQSFNEFASKNRVRIEELIQKLRNADSSMKENKELLRKQGTKTEIEEEIKEKDEQIKKYDTTGITPQEVKDYSEAQKIVDDSKKEIKVLDQDKKILATVWETSTSLSISNQELSLLSPARQKLIQKELQKKNKENLKVILSDEAKKIDTRINELNDLIANKEKVLNGLREAIEKSETIRNLTEELKNLKKTIDSIEAITGKLKEAKKERIEAIDALAKAHCKFESQQKLIYQTIKFEENFSFLKIEVVTRYSTEQLKEFVEKKINTRDSDQSIKSDEDVKVLFGDSPQEMSLDTIKKLITGLIDGKIVIKTGAGDKSLVIAELLRNRLEIDYLKSVKTQDGEAYFKDMTGGQKAIVLLELIFRFDDNRYPILIDQPEDDLDVGGVASDLVNFVTTEKQARQIIIATHNASLVICADTENIIASDVKTTNSGKYEFSYATGSIENADRRADIVEVLEGGESALRKRMLKLSVSLG